MKHVAGNMKSRWTDFLTTDGEKPDRDRDAEFEIGDRRHARLGLGPLGRGLAPPLLGDRRALRRRTSRGPWPIRDEPHTVLQAIQRQLTHYAYHVGQIVFLARHFAGPRWRSLSIPKGRSRDFDVARNGLPYRTTLEETR